MAGLALPWVTLIPPIAYPNALLRARGFMVLPDALYLAMNSSLSISRKPEEISRSTSASERHTNAERGKVDLLRLKRHTKAERGK